VIVLEATGPGVSSHAENARRQFLLFCVLSKRERDPLSKNLGACKKVFAARGKQAMDKNLKKV